MVLKVTKLGIFGDSYYLEDGQINQRNSSPQEYLLRLRLWKLLFQSAPVAMGITRQGQIVSRHEFISGSIPTQEEVDQFLVDSGFEAVRQRYWLWKIDGDGFEIWLGDARDENFVLTKEGIVPIDIRLWTVD